MLRALPPDVKMKGWGCETVPRLLMGCDGAVARPVVVVLMSWGFGLASRRCGGPVPRPISDDRAVGLLACP